jgi:Tfp pilus assembly protein PilV
MSRLQATVGDRPGLRRADAGFSLVSVVVALVLLSVGVLSLSNVMTQSITMQTISAIRTSALYIAQTHMEDLRSRDPLTLAAEAVVRVDEEGNADPNGVFTREVTVASAGRNLLEVVVIVTTPRSDPIRLVTWVYDGAL